MQVAAEANQRAIAEPATGPQLGVFAGVPVEVPPKPRLALDEEGANVPLGVGPAPASGRRNGDDHAAVRVDDDPQAARSW